MTVRRKIPTIEEQKQRLKKKGIAIGRAKSRWSVYRLYNYYITQKHPKSAPRYLAYGSQKRVEQRIETAKEPEKIQITTGTGRKIRYQVIVKSEQRKIDRETRNVLLPNMSVTLNRHLSWSKKMLDVLHIEINQKFTEDTFQHDMKEITMFVRNEIIPAIDRILMIRHKFYTQGEHLVGVKVNFKTSTMMHTTDDTGMEVNVNVLHTTMVYQPVHYESGYREQRLLEAIERGAIKVFDYHNMDVTLTGIDVGFITRGYMTHRELLRA